MPSIAITGGIACGKSTAFDFLTKKLKSPSYSADKAVAQLLKEDNEIAREIIAAFSASVYLAPGEVNKERLRMLLLNEPESKKKLEDILHPRLHKQWQPQAKKALGQQDLFFIAEIPLLYEILELASFFDYVIVIAASQNVQLERLLHQRHLSPQEALSFLQLQLPLDEKIARSDYVIWNDGSPLLFEKQLAALVATLLKKLL